MSFSNINNLSSYPQSGDLVFLLFFGEGMRIFYYVGTCLSYSSRTARLSLIRKRDRSCFVISLNSPVLVGFRILRKPV